MTLVELDIAIIAKQAFVVAMEAVRVAGKAFMDDLDANLHSAKIELAELRNLRVTLAAYSPPSPAASDQPATSIEPGTKVIQ